jgi:F-type H+-transporting ATPase subunit b
MLNLPVLALLAEGSDYNPMDAGGFGGTLWTWIIFALSLPVIWKIVMGPVTSALTARDEEAQDAIRRAEEASQRAEKAQAEAEVKAGEAQAAAAKMLSEARERAEKREQEIVETARKEADALRDRTRAEIEAAKEQALEAIRSEVVDLSLAAAGQVIQRRVDAEDDRRLVAELVSGIKKESPA